MPIMFGRHSNTTVSCVLVFQIVRSYQVLVPLQIRAQPEVAVIRRLTYFEACDTTKPEICMDIVLCFLKICNV